MTIHTPGQPADFFRLGLALMCLWGNAQAAAQEQAPAAAEPDEMEALQNEVERLRQRLEEVEIRQQRESARVLEEALETAPAAGEPDGGTLDNASPGTERALATLAEAVEPEVTIGGALRFNFVHRDFVDASTSKRGESGLDIFRLNVDGQVNNILIAAEYRFYSYMHTIRYGWLGYEFSDESQLQFGIHQVPFGLLPYASHNAWFGVPYYAGLADDYDMGVKYLRQDGPWSTHIAFYKNEELNDPTDLGRYGFDLVQVGEDQQEEINRLNARVAYTFGAGSDCENEVGASAQTAQIYDASIDRKGDHWAAAAHLDSRCGRWNFQFEAASYRYDPPGTQSGAVRVGAFESSYLLAEEADIAVANIAYNLNSPWEQVEQIICYNDYSQLFKNNGGTDSRINTIGCGIGSGALFTYVDYILANNMPYFGGGSMATGGEDEWHGRLNINIGFYW
ncbi:porin [Gilvimarinus sp. F26214L]|uniref:porin n=1 Tax=Gilvimarinus sp. DZF01 TaxID=3461371 RepID=UPI004045B9DD